MNGRSKWATRFFIPILTPFILANLFILGVCTRNPELGQGMLSIDLVK